jgi:hypothetical protein
MGNGQDLTRHPLHQSTVSSGLKGFPPLQKANSAILIANFLHLFGSFRLGKLYAPLLALDWQIKRLIEVEARVSYHARRWYVHVASDFPLAHHYRAVLAWGPLAPSQ